MTYWPGGRGAVIDTGLIGLRKTRRQQLDLLARARTLFFDASNPSEARDGGPPRAEPIPCSNVMPNTHKSIMLRSGPLGQSP